MTIQDENKGERRRIKQNVHRKMSEVTALFCGNLITENRVLVFEDETSAEN